jgi:hypothetical protein
MEAEQHGSSCMAVDIDMAADSNTAAPLQTAAGPHGCKWQHDSRNQHNATSCVVSEGSMAAWPQTSAWLHGCTAT